MDANAGKPVGGNKWPTHILGSNRMIENIPQLRIGGISLPFKFHALPPAFFFRPGVAELSE